MRAPRRTFAKICLTSLVLVAMTLSGCSLASRSEGAKNAEAVEKEKASLETFVLTFAAALGRGDASQAIAMTDLQTDALLCPQLVEDDVYREVKDRPANPSVTVRERPQDPSVYGVDLTFDLGDSGKTATYRLEAESLDDSWLLRLGEGEMYLPGNVSVWAQGEGNVVQMNGLCPEPVSSNPRYFGLPGSYTVEVLNEDQQVVHSLTATTSGTNGQDASPIVIPG
jgi:hypothetical protein